MDTDIIEMWSVKLAEVAAPDEIDMAPLMTEAFITGGKEKESLFPHKKKNMLGGFGVTEIAIIFPFILQSIATNAEFISKLLSPAAPVKHSIDILDRMKNLKGIGFSSKQKKEFMSEEGLYPDLKTILETFKDEMSKSGLSREQCESIAYNTLIKLLEEPSSSILFVKAISKVPER